MSLFDKIKIRLYEVKKEPPIKSGSVDPADQQGDFVKNERDKKKIMRKLEPKSKQTELNLGNTKTTNTPKSTKRTLKGRPLGSKTKKKGETYKQLTTGSERQRQRKDIKTQFKTQQPISDLKKAKKYATGEYPKIGGGERISPKSKGTGASTGRTRIPPATVGGKSKGTTLRKVNITKPVKQSEVSKKAKQFTKKINKRRAKLDKDLDTDAQFKKSLKKAGGTGDIGYTAPDRKTKVAKRTTRAIKQGTPDPFDSKTKFSQKQFNKTLKSRGIKVPQVPLIPDPFGQGDTKGQMNVKGLQAKAFKKTQPKDVKLPKSFTDFSKKLKTLKTDVAKTASATPRTVTKKYKPTTTVKQSEVSKKAKDFTTKVNQARTKKVTPTTTASKPKTTNVFKKVTAATSGKKVTNSKGIGNKFRGKENIAARNAEIVKRGGSVTGGGKPPKKPPTKSGIFGFFDPDKKPRNIVKKLGPDSTGKVNLFRSGQSKYGANPIVKVLKKSKNPLAKQAYKTGLKLGPGGRALVKKGGIGGVAVAGLLSSPNVRKFIGGALPGGAVGLLAGKKKEAKPKAVLSPEVKLRTTRFSLSPGEKGGFTNVKYPKKS